MKARFLAIHSLLLIAGVALVVAGGMAILLCLREPMFYENGTFVLHPRDGHPMVCSSGKRIHFNWDGEPVMITPGAVPPGLHTTEFKRIRELTSTVELADTTIEVDGDVIATALSPTVPDGWKRCMAVTVGKGRREKLNYIGGGEDAYTKIEYEWDEFTAQFYDFHTAEIVAEIDLNEMYETRRQLLLSTIGRDMGELQSAAVMAGYLGYQDEVGMTAQFKTGEHSSAYETGILDHQVWLVMPSTSSGYGIPQEVPDIFNGTQGRSAAVYRMTEQEALLTFFDLSSGLKPLQMVSTPSAKFHLNARYLAEPVLTLLYRLLKSALAACTYAAIVHFILAGIWHFLLPRRAS